MEPILHLSLPVNDFETARRFYVDGLGCRAGRAGADTVDVWFFGLQLTLHEEPGEVLERQGVRHFGATLDRAELDAVYARLTAAGTVPLRPLATRLEGTPQEETKAYFADPSGNVIELKAYADLTASVLANTSYA